MSASRLYGIAICALFFSFTTVAFAAGDSSSPLVVAGPADDRGVTPLALVLERYEAIREAGTVTIRGFPLRADLRVDLSLERFDVFTDDAVIVAASEQGERFLERPDVLLLRGRVLDESDSHVYLALSPLGNQGLIQMGGRRFVVSSGPFVRAGGTVVYDLDQLPDGAINWAPFRCYADLLDAPPGPDGAGDVGLDQPQGDPPCRVAEVAIETDREFTSILFGGNLEAASAYAAHLTGAISEIYRRDFNAGLDMTFLRLWEGDDPWNQGRAGDQLVQFRDYWEANMEAIERDDAHFYSGRPLGGGVAWLPGLCNGQWAYALSANLNGFFPYPLEDNHGQNWDPYVVAHEFGHNFGAAHTHDMMPPVDLCAEGQCRRDGTIMSYCHGCPGGMVNIALHFHPRNIAEHVLPYLARARCDLTQHPDCRISCARVDRVTAKCKLNRSKVKGVVRSSLPVGTIVTLTLDGGDEQPATVKGNGRARATWRGVPGGPHEVCLVECERCDSCQP